MTFENDDDKQLGTHLLLDCNRFYKDIGKVL